jgi:3'-phosphoadenosine 5'-phosphosulfate sulfotransferase (PAPS reductase)/FAD synthetase
MRPIKEIMCELHRVSGGTVTVGFSRGKDSRLMLAILLEYGFTVYPVYFNHLPIILPFIRADLDYCEERYGVEIEIMPHPMLFDLLRHQSWQGLHGCRHLAQYSMPVMRFENMLRAYTASLRLGYLWDCVGMKQCDSYNRRLLLRKVGEFYRKKMKCYPISHLTHRDVHAGLAKRGIKEPIDYKIWGSSFDRLGYSYLHAMKRELPDDFALLQEYFPLIDVEVHRYDAFRG